MITTSDETWATDTLRDAQDPGAGEQEWKPLTRITLERYNLIFTQQHSRGYATTGQPEHDCATALEGGFATLLKVVVGGASNGLGFTKWSVASGLELDDIEIVGGASISDTAAPSMEVTAGAALTIRVFYVDEDDNYIHYKESSNGGSSWGAEQNVGALTNATAIASVSTTKVHCVSHASGNSRLHVYEDDGGWSVTNSLIYWPHKIEYIDAITIGDRDLIVFYSEGPMYGSYREAGIYGCWYEHGRWSDFFAIDVLDEHTNHAYRKHPMLSTANGIYFLTGFLSEGDADYSNTDRFVKTSKDGQYWRQYIPLVCAEGGPAKLLVVNAASGQSWPWSTGQQAYICGFDKIYESDATRFVGEVNTDLQVDVSSRTKNWDLQRGIIASASTVLSNHDGGLDSHSIITANNTLLLKREAGYYTGAGAEYAQITLEEGDVIKETDRLPQRHKQVVSRDRMKWVRDNEADHYEEWVSQLVGYDNYDDDTDTGYGGLGHTATQKGWWETKDNKLWLKSDNEEGLAFATWDSRIINGQVKAMIRIETASNGEYAGVVFRARDEGNFWAAYYDETTDKIKLRKKVGGTWETAVAQSSTLSWSIDTWYGIMVDFRYSYFRVFYSTDGLAWTQAFTYTAPVNALNTPLEYGYVGLIGYGYSSDDDDEEPGYVPPAPPPPVIPPSGDGHLLYFVDATSGRVFRTRNARNPDPTAVIYEDLGVVDAGGLLYITLDSWNPKNCAMVCGDNGVWKTTNLDSSTPTWTKVLDGAPFNGGTYNHNFKMIASSICQEDLWMVVSRYWNGDQGDWFLCVLYSTTGGGLGTWTLYWVDIWAQNCGVRPTIEASSHDAQVAWVCWVRSNDETVTKTTDCWASHANKTIPGIHDSQRPSGYHRYLQNDADLYALFAGKSGTGAREGAVTWSTDDGSTGVGGGGIKLNEGTAGDTYWCGGYTWGTNKYWALNRATDFELHISDDAINWTLQYTFPGTTQFISGWPYDGERFYACQNGTAAPILISDDRGATFQAQTGNWATLGYSGDIVCCVPIWTE
jgi:hypothetical protein